MVTDTIQGASNCSRSLPVVHQSTRYSCAALDQFFQRGIHKPIKNLLVASCHRFGNHVFAEMKCETVVGVVARVEIARRGQINEATEVAGVLRECDFLGQLLPAQRRCFSLRSSYFSSVQLCAVP